VRHLDFHVVTSDVTDYLACALLQLADSDRPHAASSMDTHTGDIISVDVAMGQSAS